MKNIEHKLKLLKFNELNQFSKLKNTALEIAIAAYINTTVWRDDYFALYLINKIPKTKHSNLTIFVIGLTYLSIGEIKKFKLIYSYAKKNKFSRWKLEWFELELLGRTLKFKEQTRLLTKIYYKNNMIQDFHVYAVLTPLTSKNADYTYLRKFCLDLEKNKKTIPLDFLIRLGKINHAENDFTNQQLLEFSNSLYLKKVNFKKLIKIYDFLAKNHYLDVNALNRWLGLSILMPETQQSVLDRITYAYENFDSNRSIKCMSASYLLIYFFLRGDYKTVFSIAKRHEDYLKMKVIDALKNSKIYFNYILLLCLEWENNKDQYEVHENKLIVFGESHSLALTNISINFYNKKFTALNHLLIGVKMFHLNLEKSNYFSEALAVYLNSIKDGSNLLFTIGEIDTRPNEGIWKLYRRTSNSLEFLVNKTVDNYLIFLHSYLKDKTLSSITIQGIPAPGYMLEDAFDPGKEKQKFLKMFKLVNNRLKEKTLFYGWQFLDIYSATVNLEGTSNQIYHLDKIHLTPLFYTQADKWLIKPEPKKQETEPNTIDFSQYSTLSLSKPN